MATDAAHHQALAHVRRGGVGPRQRGRAGAGAGQLAAGGAVLRRAPGVGFSAAVVVVLTWSAAVFGGTTGGRAAPTSSAPPHSASPASRHSAGLVSQNQTLYLAWPSVENMIYGVAFFGSALLGRPLLALYAQRLYPIPAERARVAHISPRVRDDLGGVAVRPQPARGAAPVAAADALPLEVYLVVDTVAGWPINVSLFAFTAWYPLRELRRAGFMSVVPRPISAMDAVELAVEESAPTTV